MRQLMGDLREGIDDVVGAGLQTRAIGDVVQVGVDGVVGAGGAEEEDAGEEEEGEGDDDLEAARESLAQTRLHFRNLVAGFGPDDEAAHIDYTEDLAPFLPSSKREEAVGLKASRKGKERASLSGVDGGGGGPGGSPARDGEGIATPSSAGKKKRRSEG
ncbi:hypothetical protein BTJ68_02902 [Hortaea werneckii EXF-2000]|uniref:Uncharacterized protein n=1 Tax=Hortaea werneckii EXF-2000 TaxID=1157616 RepID=A0A1Z5TL16_HORWE|nr:hypothetical protein BTJ68_02902 [Hortaea werneckii EXF-2000]